MRVFYNPHNTSEIWITSFGGGLRVGTTDTPAQPGDFDGDYDVDGADFVIWQTNFPKTSGGTLATGDADGDGDVDGADFVVWQTNFPTSPGSASAAGSPAATDEVISSEFSTHRSRRWRPFKQPHGNDAASRVYVGESLRDSRSNHHSTDRTVTPSIDLASLRSASDRAAGYRRA